MAEPKKPARSSSSRKPAVVTKETGTKSKATSVKKKTVSSSSDGTRRQKPAVLKPVSATGGYFAGAWREIREVRWPNRRSTWSLTLAVLIFSAFWAAVILGLDLLFDAIFRDFILS